MKFLLNFTKIRRKVINHYTAAVMVGFPYLCISIAMHWLTVAVTKLKASGDAPQLLENDCIDLMSWSVTGLLISSAANIFVQDRHGRKLLMVSGQVIALVGWPILIYSSSPRWWIVARAVMGLGCGSILTSGYVYVAEISEDHMRGLMESVLEVMFNSGTIILFALNTFVSLQTLTICCGIFATISGLLLLLIPESPYYLVSKAKSDEAESVLMILRGKVEPSEVADEMKKIENTVAEDRYNSGTFLDLFIASRNVKPFLLSASLMIFNSTSGYSVIGSYITVIFSETGSGFDENIAGLVLSCVLLIVTFLSSPLSDRFGRRPILMISYSGCTLGLSSLALHFYLKEFKAVNTDWLPLCSLVVYYASHGMGLISWAVASELLPLRIRAPAVAVIMIVCGLANYGCVEIYRNGHKIGNHVAFLCYAIVCVFGLLFVAFILPETKRMSFIEIDRNINCANSKNDRTVKENSTQL